MIARFLPVLAVPFLIAPAAGGETFPKGDVFTPLVADPIEPRNFISFLHLDADRTIPRLARSASARTSAFAAGLAPSRATDGSLAFSSPLLRNSTSRGIRTPF